MENRDFVGEILRRQMTSLSEACEKHLPAGSPELANFSRVILEYAKYLDKRAEDEETYVLAEPFRTGDLNGLLGKMAEDMDGNVYAVTGIRNGKYILELDEAEEEYALADPVLYVDAQTLDQEYTVL